MQQVIVELDEKTLTELDRVAPAKARKRSEFIREAIRKALNERLEAEMERAYRRIPHQSVDHDIDPSTWATARAKKRRAR